MFLLFLINESIVGILLPCNNAIEESDFGSHPINITLYPITEQAAAIFVAVLDFPIPPLP